MEFFQSFNAAVGSLGDSAVVSSLRARSPRASLRAHGVVALGDACSDQLPNPRVVTTGRKKSSILAFAGSIRDPETDEPVELFSRPHGIEVLRHLEPVQPAREGVALVDALAFSIVPPDENSYDWVLREMAQFLEISDLQHRKGLFGFRFSARFGEGAGIVAWGGESQRGRVYFSLMGKGCSMITRWADLASWLEQHRATIKRADLAYDDFAGRLVSIAWAIE